MEEYFSHCTVITIAHRIATVIESDKILVMQDGVALEFEHPFKLLAANDEDEDITRESRFAEIVKATGIETSKSLFEFAKTSYNKH